MKHLDTSSTSDLSWEINPDPEGCYTLDFGWSKINPHDEATFQRDYLAIESFSKKFPDAKQVVIAHLDGDFASLIELTEVLEMQREEENLPLQVFCAQLLSDYFHRLASALPEEAIPTIVVDPKQGINRSLLTLMFSRRRFEYFRILFTKDQLPIDGQVETILSLPQDSRFDPIFFETLLENYTSFKCIPEELLNEHWDEALEIVYDSQSLGELGERMLLGFEAAGGCTKKAR